MLLAKTKVIGRLLVRDVLSHSAVVDLPSAHPDHPSFLDTLQIYFI